MEATRSPRRILTRSMTQAMPTTSIEAERSTQGLEIPSSPSKGRPNTVRRVSRGDPADFQFLGDAEKERHQDDIPGDCFGNNRVRLALKAFGRAAEASKWGGRESASQLMSKKLMETQKCEYLVGTGTRLLSAVAAATNVDLGVLRRLPSAIACKALELGSEAHQPEVKELEKMKLKVQYLEQQHQNSSRAYLDEVVFWRTRARRGDTDVVFGPLDRYFWDAIEALPKEQQAFARDVIIEKLRCYVSQDEAIVFSELQIHLRKTQERVRASEAETEELRTQHDDAHDANQELESRLHLQGTKMREMEKTQTSTSNAVSRCRAAEDSFREEKKKVNELSLEIKDLRKLLADTQGLKLQNDLQEAKQKAATQEARAVAAEESLKKMDFDNLILRDVDNLSAEDILQKDFPRLASRLGDATSAHISDWMQGACTRLTEHFDAVVESRAMEVVMRQALERKLEATLQQLDAQDWDDEGGESEDGSSDPLDGDDSPRRRAETSDGDEIDGEDESVRSLPNTNPSSWSRQVTPEVADYADSFEAQLLKASQLATIYGSDRTDREPSQRPLEEQRTHRFSQDSQRKGSKGLTEHSITDSLAISDDMSNFTRQSSAGGEDDLLSFTHAKTMPTLKTELTKRKLIEATNSRSSLGSANLDASSSTSSVSKLFSGSLSKATSRQASKNGSVLSSRRRRSSGHGDSPTSRRGSASSEHSSSAAGTSNSKKRNDTLRLHRRHEADKREIEETQKKLEQAMQANHELEIRTAHMEQLEEELQKTKVDLSEAASCQLHPARVAEVQAEARQAKQDAFATKSLNTTLQSTLEYMQQRLTQQAPAAGRLPQKDPACADVKYLGHQASRTVHTRLYEDAVRRHGQLQEIIDAMRLRRMVGDDQDGHSQEEDGDGHRMRRSNSAPSRVLLWGEINEMIQANASNLAEFRNEPLLSQPLVLPEDKARKPPLHQPVPLVSSSPEPTLDKMHDRGYQEQDRVGSLVVWQRTASPWSQAPTTAPNSPSPEPIPGSRPMSACSRWGHSQGRPGSAPGTARKPRIVKALPSKLLEDRNFQSSSNYASEQTASEAKGVAPTPRSPLKSRTLVQDEASLALVPVATPSPAAVAAAARAALAAASSSPFANVMKGEADQVGQRAAKLATAASTRPKSSPSAKARSSPQAGRTVTK